MNIGIVIPGSVNYFYNVTGERTREALAAVGHHVDVFTLRDYHNGETAPTYDLCILVNIVEITVGYGNDIHHSDQKLREMLANMDQVAAVGLDAAQTQWFANLIAKCHHMGVGTLLDYGLNDQTALLPPDFPLQYRFVFNGLTPTEREDARRQLADTHPRMIPWAFVGHATPERQKLIYDLSQYVAVDGFVYVPPLEPITADGQHLNREQLQTVLNHAQCFVWCSHHDFFYMESVRFRQALESGTIPIKVVLGDLAIPEDIPFDYLVIHMADLETALRDFPFEITRGRFIRDYLNLPGLDTALAEALQQLDLTT